MRTALQVLMMEPELAENASGSAHVLSFPIVGSAAQSNFGISEAEMISRAGFNYRQRLNELRRRTGEGKELRVACSVQQRPLGVNNRKVNAVDTFRYASAVHADNGVRRLHVVVSLHN
ncbi:hypothetical protein J2Z65_000441 [Paenibacillus aceris]|uniref:Uncharacterized protein n=1 Tax=Paenibacillus aceris TaxID=869555 RepID=A0ABS4HRK9_9BACL|nr:hypothetical protein [Paenibacillus aceris]